jgi:hypothetical protein
MRPQRIARSAPPDLAPNPVVAPDRPPAAYDPAVLVQALPLDVLHQLIGAAAWPPDEANAVVEMTGPGTRALLLTFGVIERHRLADGNWSVRLTEEGCGFLRALVEGTLLPPPVRPVADSGRTASIGRVLPARRTDGSGPPPPLTGYYDLWAEDSDPEGAGPSASVKIVRDGDKLLLWQTSPGGAVVHTLDGRELPQDGKPVELIAGGAPPPAALRDLLNLTLPADGAN